MVMVLTYSDRIIVKYILVSRFILHLWTLIKYISVVRISTFWVTVGGAVHSERLNKCTLLLGPWWWSSGLRTSVNPSSNPAEVVCYFMAQILLEKNENKPKKSPDYF